MLPAELRRVDEVRAGEAFQVERLGLGVYRLVRVQQPAGRGLVDWLRECPEKGYFVPIESESADTL